MQLSEIRKPALALAAIAALAGGYYWREHRPRREAKDTPAAALVVVSKAVNSCFSDLVRVTGFVVPRREPVAGVDLVTDGQELARLTPLPLAIGAKTTATPSVRAPGAGLITEVRTAAWPYRVPRSTI